MFRESLLLMPPLNMLIHGIFGFTNNLTKLTWILSSNNMIGLYMLFDISVLFWFIITDKTHPQVTFTFGHLEVNLRIWTELKYFGIWSMCRKCLLFVSPTMLLHGIFSFTDNLTKWTWIFSSNNMIGLNMLFDISVLSWFIITDKTRPQVIFTSGHLEVNLRI